MRDMFRRVLAALTHSGPGYEPPHMPRRGDAFEQWLKAQRDQREDNYGRTPAWWALDGLLDTYRLHADTRTPLDQHACEARATGDCDCLESEARS